MMAPLTLRTSALSVPCCPLEPSEALSDVRLQAWTSVTTLLFPRDPTGTMKPLLLRFRRPSQLLKLLLKANQSKGINVLLDL